MSAVRGSAIQDSADALRAAMVDEVRDLEREMGAALSETVAGAMSAVPRHLFAPGVPLEVAYETNRALVIKRDPEGAALSSLSAAHIQAMMLTQAEIEPGMRVLEIGSGGYNAALIQEIVGEDGKVTSVDVDPEIVTRAQACLDTASYDRVDVVLADAEHGVPENAPYDRIIVTAGSWDIPPAWLDQLTGLGRLVVPLRMRGITRSIAFDREGADLISRSYRLCGFVPMQGDGAHSERSIRIGDDIALRTDDETLYVDAGAVLRALYSPMLRHWSGAAFDLPDELELFLVTNAPQVAMLHVSERLVKLGFFTPAASMGVAALVKGGSLAYRTKRVCGETGGFESGVIARGTEAEELAEYDVGLLRRWAKHHRRRHAARIRYTPDAAATSEQSPDVIAKRHGTVVVSWP